MNNIIFKNNVFALNTANTTYLFRVDKFNHLEHVYYGQKVSIEDTEALRLKMTAIYGDTVLYDTSDDTYAMDVLPQEYASSGRGDFREPSLEIEINGSNTTDFTYKKHKIVKGNVSPKGLPSAYGADETLIVSLTDEIAKIQLDLYYSVYSKEDVIVRRSKLTNLSKDTLTIHKLMSSSIDLFEGDLRLMSFYGGWANEANLSDTLVTPGRHVVESRVGFSSSRTNPGFILKYPNTNETSGKAFGFNFVYSGSHYSSISMDEHKHIRVMTGINPERFELKLKTKETLETPEVVLTTSSNGLNDLSHHFHDFINNHIVRTNYQNKERPILVNDWEAYMFDFNEDKLVNLASKAKQLGIELFVLDDGWFGDRNNDHAGLGDYDVNLKKLPNGIKGLSKKIHNLGMKFGLWVEPEAINPDSKLFRKHPEYAIRETNRRDVYGRNELLLDLTNKAVQDYLVSNISKLIDDNKIDYIKWDMNRQLTGISGQYNYEYMLGLYSVLDRIFKKRPHVLLESCSSGGNRFDLGIMCYSPQIWTSDNTDAISRMRIQRNLSYLYPQSTMGAHVSACPNAQTLRTTPINTRFNVAAFGGFGYELDVNELSPSEQEEVRKQVSFYKKHRNTFQYGTYYRIENKEAVQVSTSKETIVANYRKLIYQSPGYESLVAYNLKSNKQYTIKCREFDIDNHHSGKETYKASGSALNNGIQLNNLFNGSGINEDVRIPADYGSELYVIK